MRKDGYVLTDLSNGSDEYLSVNIDYLYWVPNKNRAYWKIASDATSSLQRFYCLNFCNIFSTKRKKHCSELSLFSSNASVVSDFVVASQNSVNHLKFVIFFNSFQTISASYDAPKWTALDDNIPFHIYDQQGEFIMQPAKLIKSTTQVPISETRDNTFITSLHEHDTDIQNNNDTTAHRDSLASNTSSKHSVPAISKRTSRPTSATPTHRTIEYVQDAITSNRVIQTGDGSTLSIPNEVTDTNGEKDIRTLRNSWKALPMKQTFIVHNPLERHPFLYAPPARPAKKTLQPHYTRSMRDLEEQQLFAQQHNTKTNKSRTLPTSLASSLTTTSVLKSSQETTPTPPVSTIPQGEQSFTAKRVHFV